MTLEAIILASATVTGPVISVGIALWRQGKFEEEQRQFQRELLLEIEKERSDFQSKLENERLNSQKELQAQRLDFEAAWNKGARNRDDRLNQNLWHLVRAVNPKYKIPDIFGNLPNEKDV